MIDIRKGTGSLRTVWWWEGVQRAGPFLIAALVLIFGYTRYAPGTEQIQAYHAWAFAELRYSDIIWLYVRDDGTVHPRPYLDYPLEYPALTGALIYLLGFAPDLRTYFALTYAVLATCALGTIAVLGRMPGVNPWYFAAAPALYFYAGLNWDLAAIAMAVLALLGYSRDRDRWATLALVGAVWLKFFPIVFLAAILIERLRARRLRAAAEIVGLFALGSAAINLPLAYANRAGWEHFFTFNRDRRADSGPWVELRHLTTTEVNQLSLAVTVLGGLALAIIAFRVHRPVLLPLGASLLLWWLMINKVFSPQYMLWAFLALALLCPPWSLWTGAVAVDVVGFYIGFMIQFSLVHIESERLLGWEFRHLYDPLQLLRTVLFLLAIAWAVHLLIRDGMAGPRHPVSAGVGPPSS